MRLTNAELDAIISAGREVQAGEMEEAIWPQAKADALASALDKLVSETMSLARRPPSRKDR